MQNTTRKSGKVRGISGRSKNTDIEKRKEIIKEVLDNRDLDLTLQGLRDTLKKRFVGKGIGGGNLSLPSNETIKKDCYEVGYKYKNHRFELVSQSTKSEEMARDILTKYLKEIIVLYLNKTYILYPFLTHCQDLDGSDKSNNPETSQVYDNNAFDKYYEAIQHKLMKNITTNFDIIQITIALTQHCYEQTLADIIIDSMFNNFLYVAVNPFCIQIFCHKQNLQNIFDFVFSIMPMNINTDTLITYKSK